MAEPKKTEPVPPHSKCILHQGYIRPSGYGQVGRNKLAHRVIYEQIYGPIPDGYDIHHVCGVRACINPDHLRALTRLGHIQTTAPVQNERCPKGHRYNRVGTQRG